MLIIFDIDNTIADIKHREHLIKSIDDLKCDGCDFVKSGQVRCNSCLTCDSWMRVSLRKAFFSKFFDPELMKKDPPIKSMQEVQAKVRAELKQATMFYLTGRDECSREATEKWIIENSFLQLPIHMRPHLDPRSNYDLRREALTGMMTEKRFNRAYVFDDDPFLNGVYTELGVKQILPIDAKRLLDIPVTAGLDLLCLQKSSIT